MTYQILLGNNLDILPTLADNSIDSIVTDPPYELGFMGKKWDSSGIAYSVELWQQCLRVLKPGGHLLAFSGSRTYHRMVVSIEDAGFDIRDMISWISNKTFPKSLDIGKAIDKAAGAEVKIGTAFKVAGEYGNRDLRDPDVQGPDRDEMRHEAKTLEAQQWQGWGTGLKPTVEPIVMARKPVEGTVANNVLKHGTGGLNIDGSRIAHDDSVDLNAMQRQQSNNPIRFGEAKPGDVISMYKPDGRWPANLVLDEQTAQLLDKQTSHLHAAGNKQDTAVGFDKGYGSSSYEMSYKGRANRTHDDSGGASRFFYVAKASKRDRNEGLQASNTHPTVKPTTLMEYLIKLVTPPGGTVLDPFTGSGSTGKAAILQGFDFIGIELTEEYLPIIEGRLKHAEALVAESIKETANKQSEVLF